MKNPIKYTLRKLAFLVILATLVASPFGIAEYKSLTTTDPYILMAREIERYPIGGIDVLYVADNPRIPDSLSILVFIPEYSKWSERKDVSNFKRDVLGTIANYGYKAVGILVGWDFPPPRFRAQGLISCLELRKSSCIWEPIPSIEVDPEYVKWPGIGKP